MSRCRGCCRRRRCRPARWCRRSGTAGPSRRRRRGRRRRCGSHRRCRRCAPAWRSRCPTRRRRARAHEAFWVQLPQSTSPVAAAVRQLGWLLSTLGQHGGDLAGAVAAVVAHPVDVEAVRRRGGVDLEADRAALVDADVGREALDGGSPAPVMPHSLSGLPGLVFSHATGLVTGASHGAAAAGVEVTSTDSPDAATMSRHQDGEASRTGHGRLLAAHVCAVAPRTDCGGQDQPILGGNADGVMPSLGTLLPSCAGRTGRPARRS